MDGWTGGLSYLVFEEMADVVEIGKELGEHQPRLDWLRHILGYLVFDDAEVVGQDDDGELVVLALQRPGTVDPVRHLQDDEHSLPGVPFRGPSSHSSSRLGSQMPSPQPAGVAPLTMMYGIPLEPSAKVFRPLPVAPWAMASGSKP